MSHPADLYHTLRWDSSDKVLEILLKAMLFMCSGQKGITMETGRNRDFFAA